MNDCFKVFEHFNHGMLLEVFLMKIFWKIFSKLQDIEYPKSVRFDSPRQYLWQNITYIDKQRGGPKAGEPLRNFYHLLSFFHLIFVDIKNFSSKLFLIPKWSSKTFILQVLNFTTIIPLRIWSHVKQRIDK